jgi:hypothetical protein
MTKSKSTQTGGSKATPDKLSKVDKKSGIELNETELGQASGGAVDTFLKLGTLKPHG